MKTIVVEGVSKPIFSWCPNIEDSALEQMKTIARLPFVEHCALMPDAHLGKIMPIGGVVATKDIVVPDFCGVDAGCGVCAVKSTLTKEDIKDLRVREKIYHSVCRGIPMGFSRNNQNRIKELKTKYKEKSEYIFEKSKILCSEYNVLQDPNEAFWSSLGTMGSGNHFNSLEYDEDGYVWILCHSGSRNIGKKICDYFDGVAEGMNKKWHSIDSSVVPYLPSDSPEGKGYLDWLDFALRFAYLNRLVMVEEIKKDILHDFGEVEFCEMINIHHNYTALESHFGKNLWVHRKGAVLAREGVVGVIPGSCGTGSYISRGLGNDKSLNSSSHGAGRKMGRSEFNKNNNTEEKIEEIMRSMDGIVYSRFGKESSRKGKETGRLDVSEAPQAYKNIVQVMSDQSDLVAPVHRLIPLVNWKDSGEDD